MSAVRERDIENHLVRRVEALGGEVRKAQWVGRRGAPDRLVMFPSPPPHKRMGCKDTLVQAIWVELKAPGEKAKPHQLREHEKLRAMGQRVEVIDSIEGVEQLLAAWSLTYGALNHKELPC